MPLVNGLHLDRRLMPLTNPNAYANFSRLPAASSTWSEATRNRELADQLKDEQYPWRVCEGNMLVQGDLIGDRPLVVEGDLIVDGALQAGEAGYFLVLVGGDLVARNLACQGAAYVQCNVYCSGVTEICDHYGSRCELHLGGRLNTAYFRHQDDAPPRAQDLDPGMIDLALFGSEAGWQETEEIIALGRLLLRDGPAEAWIDDVEAEGGYFLDEAILNESLARVAKDYGAMEFLREVPDSRAVSALSSRIEARFTAARDRPDTTIFTGHDH